MTCQYLHSAFLGQHNFNQNITLLVIMRTIPCEGLGTSPYLTRVHHVLHRHAFVQVLYVLLSVINVLALSLYYIARANVLATSDRDMHHGRTLPKGAERKRLDIGHFFLFLFVCTCQEGILTGSFSYEY